VHVSSPNEETPDVPIVFRPWGEWSEPHLTPLSLLLFQSKGSRIAQRNFSPNPHWRGVYRYKYRESGMACTENTGTRRRRALARHRHRPKALRRRRPIPSTAAQNRSVSLGLSLYTSESSSSSRTRPTKMFLWPTTLVMWVSIVVQTWLLFLLMLPTENQCHKHPTVSSERTQEEVQEKAWDNATRVTGTKIMMSETNHHKSKKKKKSMETK